MVIDAKVLDPTIDRRNDTIYKNTLFERDDQLVQTLNAGINVGQHEGGGKSLGSFLFGQRRGNKSKVEGKTEPAGKTPPRLSALRFSS
ncbi:MAG: hypothetical protein ABI923_01690 [bacterium]